MFSGFCSVGPRRTKALPMETKTLRKLSLTVQGAWRPFRVAVTIPVTDLASPMREICADNLSGGHTALVSACRTP